MCQGFFWISTLPRYYFFQFFKTLCYFLFTIYVCILCISFLECNCDRDGSLGGNCDDAGKCTCKTGIDGVFQGFSGEKCDACIKGFYGFPYCEGGFMFSFFLKRTSQIIPIFHFIFLFVRV